MEVDFGDDSFELVNYTYDPAQYNFPGGLSHEDDWQFDEGDWQGYEGDEGDEGDDDEGRDKIVDIDPAISAMFPVATRHDRNDKLTGHRKCQSSSSTTKLATPAQMRSHKAPEPCACFPFQPQRRSDRKCSGPIVFQARMLSLPVSEFTGHKTPTKLLLHKMPAVYKSAADMYSTVGEMCMFEALAAVKEAWKQKKISSFPNSGSGRVIMVLTKCQLRGCAKARLEGAAPKEPTYSAVGQIAQDLSFLHFSFSPDLRKVFKENKVGPGTLFMLQPNEPSLVGTDTRQLAICVGSHGGGDTIILRTLWQSWWCLPVLESGTTWTAVALCSVLSMQRMYSACYTKPSPPFLSQLLGTSPITRTHMVFDDDNPKGIPVRSCSAR
jgi:hypothetical protein